MTDRLAAAAVRELARSHSCDPATCPDAATLIAFADGALDAAERDRLATRIADCAGCAAALRVALDADDWAQSLAAELHSAQRGDTVIRLQPPAARAPLPRWPLALAASLGLLVMAGVLLRQPPPADVLRGASTVASDPLDQARLAQWPQRLQWSCERAPGAASVELLGVDAQLLWSAPVQSCAAVLPQSLRDRLPPGEYLWRVRNAAGDTLVGPLLFQVQP